MATLDTNLYVTDCTLLQSRSFLILQSSQLEHLVIDRVDVSGEIETIRLSFTLRLIFNM